MLQLRVEEVRVAKVSTCLLHAPEAHFVFKDTCSSLESELELAKEKIESSAQEKLSLLDRYNTQVLAFEELQQAKAHLREQLQEVSLCCDAGYYIDRFFCADAGTQASRARAAATVSRD